MIMKRGTQRDDGFVFVKYHSNGSPYWVPKEQFERMIQHEKLKLKLNRERIAERRREYQKSNADKLKKYHATWRKDNPEKRLAMANRQRAARKQAIPQDSWKKGADGIYAIAHRISECLGVKHHVDHIIPIAKGGTHERGNLQILPAKLNLKKSDKLNFNLPSCYSTQADWA
jgi:hypothetical protein